MAGNTRLLSSDPLWSERVRRRRAFADAELDRGGAPTPLPVPAAAPAAVFCRHLLAALLTNYAPVPTHTQQQRPKISFSIESIIGVQ